MSLSERELEYRRQYHTRYYNKHFDRWLFAVAKFRARKKDVEFTITIDDVIIPSHCPYLGIELDPTQSKGRGWRLNCPSLDRIDPSRGYVPGNVEVISRLANLMKQDATPEQLMTFAKSVLRRFS